MAQAQGGLAGDTRLFGSLLREESPGVYSFPLFTPGFCAGMVAELDAHEAFVRAETGRPPRRPNSMNNYGAVLSDLGMAPWLAAFQRSVAQPIAARLFPEVSAAHVGPLDGLHAFSVRYKAGEDLGLDVHTDDSDVTFNACLGKPPDPRTGAPGFQGSGLVFCGKLGEGDHRVFRHRYTHELGRCVVHLGRQRHGADDIVSGERVNLIFWNRSSAFRRRLERNPPPYQRESAEPSLECLSFTHDRDFAARNPSHPKSKPSHFGSRGWCPPHGKEYLPPSNVP